MSVQPIVFNIRYTPYSLPKNATLSQLNKNSQERAFYSMTDKYNIYTYMTDTSATYSVTVDRTAPTISGASTSTTGKYTNTAFTVTTADSSSGVATLYYKLSTGSYEAASSASYVTIAANATNGLYYFYCVDKAGNTSATYYVNLDTVVPTINNASTSTIGKYTNAAFTVTTADSFSGVATLYYKLSTASGYTVSSSASSVTIPATSTNGLYYFYCVDKAGNTSATYYVNLDTIAPTISGASTSTTGYSTNANFTVLTNDNFSGVVRLYYKSPTDEAYTLASSTSSLEILNTSGDGLYSFYCMDKAGNESEIYYVNLDTVIPTLIGASISKDLYETGEFTVYSEDGDVVKIYYKSPTATEYIKVDGYTVTISANSGDGWYSFYCEDTAGNYSEIYYVYLDTVAPVGHVYVDGEEVENGYTVTSDTTANKLAENADYSLQISFGVTENGSGIDYIMVKLPNAEEYELMENGSVYGGLCGEYAFYAVDIAGNVSLIYTVVVEHNYEETYYATTCTESGYTLHTCSICGDWYIDEIISAYGHIYDEGVEVAATCTTSGGTYYTCLICGYEHVENYVEALGHNFVIDTESFVAATCTSEGSRTYVCSREGCDECYTTSIVQTAHSYTVIATIDNSNGTVTKIYACTHEVETSTLTTLIASFTSDEEILAYFENNDIDGILIETTGKTYTGIAGFITSVYDRYSPYMVWVLLATVAIWSLAMGVRFAIANKNEEKEKAKKMVVNYCIGIVAIFVLLMAVPYLANLFVVLLTG